MELLGREADGAVPVRGVAQRREEGARLGHRGDAHALGGRRVDHDARGAETPREQELGEGAPERVAHDDRRRVERLDDGGQVVQGLRDGEVGDELRVLPEPLDLDLETGVAGRQDGESLLLVVRDPPLPAPRGHPEAVHEHDGVGARIGRRPRGCLGGGRGAVDVGHGRVLSGSVAVEKSGDATSRPPAGTPPTCPSRTVRGALRRTLPFPGAGRQTLWPPPSMSFRARVRLSRDTPSGQAPATPEDPMSTQIFVNLPVQDLDAAKAFYTALGYMVNEQFTDENASSIVLSDTIYVMLLTAEFAQRFTNKAIADATATTEVINALSVGSRAEVDRLVDAAFAAGATAVKDPQEEGGFMYSRSFADLDGHQWEVLHMDPTAFEG
ncbi:Possible glyoxalase/bleomycin resistance protein/ dioxygenase [Mycobacteroides abscessus]|nr:Possible glyoxalase/bleomycin resistance protein/ dioxygenase [Mycobacteroides abscessus]